METHSPLSQICILELNVLRTVIYVEYPPITVDSLLPTRLRRKTSHYFQKVGFKLLIQ